MGENMHTSINKSSHLIKLSINHDLPQRPSSSCPLVWGPASGSVVDPACRPDTWCGTTSTYIGQGQTQHSAGFRPVAAGKTLDMEVVVGSAVTQTMYVDGEVWSAQTDSPGMRPGVFNSQSECIGDSCGTLESFEWGNLTLALRKAQPGWGGRMGLANATTEGWRTPDGGVTWTNAGIRIDKDYLSLQGRRRA